MNCREQLRSQILSGWFASSKLCVSDASGGNMDSEGVPISRPCTRTLTHSDGLRPAEVAPKSRL